jgi:hypothetical protein
MESEMKVFHPAGQTLFIECTGSNVDTTLNGVGDVLRGSIR